MKCATCNATCQPIHSARPNPNLDSVDNYHICPSCGHEVLVHAYEGIRGGLK